MLKTSACAWRMREDGLPFAPASSARSASWQLSVRSSPKSKLLKRLRLGRAIVPRSSSTWPTTISTPNFEEVHGVTRRQAGPQACGGLAWLSRRRFGLVIATWRARSNHRSRTLPGLDDQALSMHRHPSRLLGQLGRRWTPENGRLKVLSAKRTRHGLTLTSKTSSSGVVMGIYRRDNSSGL